MANNRFLHWNVIFLKVMTGELMSLDEIVMYPLLSVTAVYSLLAIICIILVAVYQVALLNGYDCPLPNDFSIRGGVLFVLISLPNLWFCTLMVGWKIMRYKAIGTDKKFIFSFVYDKLSDLFEPRVKTEEERRRMRNEFPNYVKEPLSPKAIEMVSIHEAARTVIRWCCGGSRKLTKASIDPDVKASRDYVHYGKYGITTVMNNLNTTFFEEMCIELAGYLAETLFLLKKTFDFEDLIIQTFAFKNIMKNATYLGEKYILWELQSLNLKISSPHKIEEVIEKFIRRCHKDVTELLLEHKELILKVAIELVKNKTLNRDDLLRILGPPPKEEFSLHKSHCYPNPINEKLFQDIIRKPTLTLPPEMQELLTCSLKEEITRTIKRDNNIVNNNYEHLDDV